MRFFVTAKLADGIDLGKKLLGGRKRPPFSKNGRPFFLVWHRDFGDADGFRS